LFLRAIAHVVERVGDAVALQLLYFPEERVVVIWASNDLSKRSRRTLNDVIPASCLRGKRRRVCRTEVPQRRKGATPAAPFEIPPKR
ncbi:MAG TPA: hypothetical protein VFR59_03335, partial [Steroidobacteraceae bacterium]|nr:hypothetical protein [Steroidobacteraceae bacterium]